MDRHSLYPDVTSSVEPGFNDHHNLTADERARLGRRADEAGERAYDRATRAAWLRYGPRVDRGEISYAAAQEAVGREADEARRAAYARIWRD